MSEPVAWMLLGLEDRKPKLINLQVIDHLEGTWIPLYTKPFFNQKPVAMMVKIDGFDKPEFTTTCSSAALKHPNYTALYDHPVRELTDEEIDKIIKQHDWYSKTWVDMVRSIESAILKKGK
jgi:hypothetical protein